MYNDDVRDLLEKVAAKWDATEGLAKSAENIVGDAVGSVMFELRYAGRKLVDAVRESLSENPSMDAIKAHIAEVEQNCHRAHHDAVDSIIWYARSRVTIAEDTFGKDLLFLYWKDYIPTKDKLDQLGKIVAQSREFRGMRFDVYDRMYRDDMPVVLDSLRNFGHSEDALKALAEKSRHEDDERREQHELAIRGLEDAQIDIKIARKTLFWTVGAVGVALLVGIVTVIVPLEAIGH
ncbi:hypothetical protein [Mesorhizobium sp. M0678]|uniref:hypothetical protein n=1 Tax=unclassified Mesorhizobium TaxID=325217 RepID=UPI00333586EA